MADNNDGEDENTSQGNFHQLAENKEGEEDVPRGNDWEVVSLTASTYAAAPAPRGDEEKDPTASKDYDAETSSDLIMSGHFVFPPNQHDNLPIQPENFEAAGSVSVGREGKLEQKGDQILLIHSSGFDEATELCRLDVVDHKEKDVYETDTFSSFHGATDISGLEGFGENIVVSEVQPSDEGIDTFPFVSKSPSSEKDDDTDDSDIPCGPWWKRRVVSLCAQVKDTSTFWSVFVAAAVMGLMILGQHWQQERWQVLQQRWHLSVGDEVSLLVTPLN